MRLQSGSTAWCTCATSWAVSSQLKSGGRRRAEGLHLHPDPRAVDDEDDQAVRHIYFWGAGAIIQGCRIHHPGVQVPAALCMAMFSGAGTCLAKCHPLFACYCFFCDCPCTNNESLSQNVVFKKAFLFTLDCPATRRLLENGQSKARAWGKPRWHPLECDE